MHAAIQYRWYIQNCVTLCPCHPKSKKNMRRRSGGGPGGWHEVSLNVMHNTVSTNITAYRSIRICRCKALHPAQMDRRGNSGTGTRLLVSDLFTRINIFRFSRGGRGTAARPLAAACSPSLAPRDTAPALVTSHYTTLLYTYQTLACQAIQPVFNMDIP